MPAEFYFHDGAAQRKAKEIYFHDGTAQRKAKEVWFHDGTAQRKVFASNLLVAGIAIDSYAQRDGPSGTVTLRTIFNPDGTITTTTTNADFFTPVPPGSKWHSSAPLAGVGSGYYVRFSDTPGTWSSWMPLGSAWIYSVWASSGDTIQSETVNFELSSSASGPAEVAGVFYATAEFG